MARSASDATRFTATNPHAASGPPGSSGGGFSSKAPPPPPPSGTTPSGTRLNPSTKAAPSNETPQQKIARLRAAAQAAKQPSETSWDRTVRVGRRWADRAHRVTALSLVGFTVVIGTVAAAGITDMLLHNRRRRNEWFAEQRAQHARGLAEAREAIAQGRADEDQVLLVNREVAAMEAERAKKEAPGVVKRTTGWLFGGLTQEEQKGGKLGVGRSGVGEKNVEGVLEAVGEAVESRRRTGEAVEEVVKPLGGPLDREAEAASREVQEVGKSWTSWITGR